MRSSRRARCTTVAARTLVSALVATALAGASGTALAANPNNNSMILNATVSPSGNAPGLGTVVRGTAASTFMVNFATGAVTQGSGNAVRVQSGSVTVPQVTLTCTSGSGSSEDCARTGRTFTVTIPISNPGGGASYVSNFSCGTPTGNLVAFTNCSLSGSLYTITFGPFTGTASCSGTPQVCTYTTRFNLGTTITVPASATRGNQSMSYTLTFSKTA